MVMNQSQISHSAFLKHGFSDPLPLDDRSCAGERETMRVLARMQAEGLIELRVRIVDLKPQSYAGNWPEMHRTGPTRIATWHLTDKGREAWLLTG
jgi:hypothetical protein